MHQKKCAEAPVSRFSHFSFRGDERKGRRGTQPTSGRFAKANVTSEKARLTNEGSVGKEKVIEGGMKEKKIQVCLGRGGLRKKNSTAPSQTGEKTKTKRTPPQKQKKNSKNGS